MKRFLQRPLPLFAAALLLFSFSALPAAAQDNDDDGEEIRRSEFSIDEIAYPDLNEFQIPEAERIELDNGLVVFLVEDDELPQISAIARVGAGSVYEPQEMTGLASITGTVMRTGGTASMSSDSINQALEDLGATVETSIGETSGSAYMTTLKENIGEVLPIFVSVLTEPAFAEDKVELAKTQQKSAISRRNDNPQQIAFREFDKLVYGEDSPYAKVPQYYTIDAISRNDLVSFHEAYFHPNNTLLSVWGDFDAEEMAETIRQAFADWERAEGFERPETPPVEAEREREVAFIPKEDVTQSTILMGHVGQITRDNPDYFPVIVMNEVLSGGFTSRLFNNVRTDQGLAYAVFGQYGAGYDRPEQFYSGVFTKSESTVEAAESVMTEIEKLSQEPPSEEEVALAKDAYLNSFVFNFDTRQEILGRLMTYEYYGYPQDFLEQTREGVSAVTTDDVYRVSQEYLHPDEMDILVLGRESDFSEPLSTLTQSGGEVETIDITIPTEAPGQEAAPMSEADSVAGREMLMQVREALGGSAFADVEAMRAQSAQSQGGMTVQSEVVASLPDQFRIEQETPMGNMTIVLDGDQAMAETPQGTQQLPPSVAQQIKNSLWRDVGYLMMNADDEALQVQSLGTEEIEGQTYEALRITPPAGSAFTLYVDPETMRPARMSYQGTNPQTGVPFDATDVYSNYQETGGITIPYTTTTYRGGEEAGSSTVQEFTINPDLEDGLFTLEAQPPAGRQEQQPPMPADTTDAAPADTTGQ